MPLPTFFDWNIWPPTPERPLQTKVLFERRSVLHRLAADDVALRECVERYFDIVGRVVK
jgi:hypothetical protein